MRCTDLCGKGAQSDPFFRAHKTLPGHQTLADGSLEHYIIRKSPMNPPIEPPIEMQRSWEKVGKRRRGKLAVQLSVVNQNFRVTICLVVSAFEIPANSLPGIAKSLLLRDITSV